MGDVEVLAPKDKEEAASPRGGHISDDCSMGGNFLSEKKESKERRKREQEGGREGVGEEEGKGGGRERRIVRHQ